MGLNIKSGGYGSKGIWKIENTYCSNYNNQSTTFYVNSEDVYEGWVLNIQNLQGLKCYQCCSIAIKIHALCIIDDKAPHSVCF